MNSKEKTPTWDSVLSVLICGAIALTAICIAVQWLKKPQYVSEVVADYTETVSGSNMALSENDVLSKSDSTSETEVPNADTASIEQTVVTTTATAEKKQYLIVVVRSAVMRESHTVNAEKVTYIHKGKIIELLDKYGSWYKVEYMGKIGWVHKNCVEIYSEE